MTLIYRSLPLRAPVSRVRGRKLAQAAVLALGLGGCPATAWGQNAAALDPALVALTGTWSEAQGKKVADYLRSQVQPMLSGEEAVIERSREAILAPFGTAGVSEPFVRQYARAIARELAPGTQAEPVQVRVNAMILAGRLPDASAMDPVAAGLQDENAGVRYLAAVALNGLLARELVADEQLGRVMQLVDRQLADENSSYVAAPMFKAMLDTGAFDPLLASLNNRVGWHVGRAQVGFGPEADALRGLYARLFGGEGTAEQVKQLGRASVRYLRLAAQQLEAGNVSDTESHIEIIRVGQTALTFIRERVKSAEPTPPDVVAPISQERWGDIVKIADRWADLLVAPPVGLAPADLEINIAPPAADPAAPPAAAPEPVAAEAG